MAIQVNFDGRTIVLFIVLISIILAIYLWLTLVIKIRNSKKAFKSLAEKYSMDYVENPRNLPLYDEQVQIAQDIDLSSFLFNSDATKYINIHKNLEIDGKSYDIFLGIYEERYKRRYTQRSSRTSEASNFYTFVIIRKLKSKLSFKIERAMPISRRSTKVKYGDLMPTKTNMQEFDKKYVVLSNNEAMMKRILTGEVINYLLYKKLPLDVVIELR